MKRGLPEKKETSLGNIFGARVPTVTFVFLAMAPLILVWYGSFIFNYNNADNLFLYGIQIFADGIAMAVLLGLWMTILMDVIIEQHHRVIKKKRKRLSYKNEPKYRCFCYCIWRASRHYSKDGAFCYKHGL